MLFQIFHHFHDYEGCRCCRALVTKNTYFCQLCLQHLQSVEHPHLFHRGDGPFDIYSLWDWSPLEEDRILRSLVINSKGQKDARHLKIWAVNFLNKLLQFSDYDFEKVHLVVPPTQRNFNHSLALARELSRLCGITEAQIHELQENPQLKRRSTKELSGPERKFEQGLPFILRRPITNATSIIMVDDVVTTGSTAIRMWKSLGSPKSFEVWSLASRSRLATNA